MDNSINLFVGLDLQFFSAFDNVDVNSIMEELDNEYQEDVTPSGDEIQTEEEVEETELHEQEPGSEESDGQGQAETQPNLANDDERNRAFAELRRERDRLAQEAMFLKKIADDSGMTVEQIKEQYEQNRLQKEAEERGIPVDVLKRLNTLEQENQAVKQQFSAERFNREAEATIAKYQASQEQVESTFKYIAENGMTDLVKSGAVPFEQAFKLANLDNLVDSARKNAVQEDLSKRKQRQQQAQLPVDGASSSSADDDIDAMVDADVADILGRGFY